MKAEWDEIVVALEQAVVPSEYEVDLEAVADDLSGEDIDAEAIAHSAWRMAATPPHLGDCVNREGDADGYYENPCDECQEQLVAFGRRALGFLASRGSVSGRRLAAVRASGRAAASNTPR